MKQTILDTILDRLTVKPTSQRFVFNFFSQRTNFLIQFFAPAQNTLSFFCHPQKPTQKKMKECFYPTL
jgi:hypothetical protein